MVASVVSRKGLTCFKGRDRNNNFEGSDSCRMLSESRSGISVSFGQRGERTGVSREYEAHSCDLCQGFVLWAIDPLANGAPWVGVFWVEVGKRNVHLLPDDKVRESFVVHLWERIDGVLSPLEEIGRVLRAWSLPCKVLFTVWETCRDKSNMGVGHDFLAVRMENTV